MPGSNGFLRPRNSFLPPIPELGRAADLLTEAAEALLADNQDAARECLRQADMPVVAAYAGRIMGREDRHVHRRHTVDVVRSNRGNAAARMPSAAATGSIYARDGWRCRFCGCRVVLKDARDRMRSLLPGAIRWGDEGYHAAFYALTATLDHVIPYARGGGNGLDNIVTACWPCNFGRGSYSLEEVGLADPRGRPPVLDGWDGLGRVLDRRKPDRPAAPDPAMLPTLRAKAWFAAIDRVQPAFSSRFLAFVGSCADLDVSWGINEVMIVRMKVGGITMQPFGVQRDGAVSIPWAIGAQKSSFRDFAAMLAGAIPGAVFYESPKQWIVKRAGRKVTVFELLEAATGVRSALEGLHAAIRASG